MTHDIQGNINTKLLVIYYPKKFDVNIENSLHKI